MKTIFVFTLDDPFHAGNDIAIIPAEMEVASEELIAAAISEFKQQYIETKRQFVEGAWYILVWHRYVLNEDMRAAAHPDAQGYGRDLQYEDGEFHE